MEIPRCRYVRPKSLRSTRALHRQHNRLLSWQLRRASCGLRRPNRAVMRVSLLKWTSPLSVRNPLTKKGIRTRKHHQAHYLSLTRNRVLCPFNLLSSVPLQTRPQRRRRRTRQPDHTSSGNRRQRRRRQRHRRERCSGARGAASAATPTTPLRSFPLRAPRWRRSRSGARAVGRTREVRALGITFCGFVSHLKEVMHVAINSANKNGPLKPRIVF